MQRPEREAPIPSLSQPSLSQYQSSTYIVWFLMTLLAVIVMVRGQEYYHSTTVIIFSVVVALAWWRRVALLLLVLIQIYLFILEPRNEPNLFSVVLFPLLTLIALLQGLQFETARSLPGLFQHPEQDKRSLFEQFRSIRERIAHGLSAPTSVGVSGFLLQVGLAAISVVLAGWILSFFPLNFQSRQQYRLLPEGLRVVSLAILLATIFFVVRAFMAEWSWRRLSVAQASVYLRGFLAGWMNEDWAMIRKRRRKFVLRRTRSRDRAQAKAAKQAENSKTKVK